MTAPTSRRWKVGDDYLDAGDGTFYICTVAGEPGTWVKIGPGGGGVATLAVNLRLSSSSAADLVWDQTVTVPTAGAPAFFTSTSMLQTIPAGATNGFFFELSASFTGTLVLVAASTQFVVSNPAGTQKLSLQPAANLTLTSGNNYPDLTAMTQLEKIGADLSTHNDAGSFTVDSAAGGQFYAGITGLLTWTP